MVVRRVATLLYLHYSPWSEKAAWALDHHRVVHTREHYLPMLGEPWLRLRTKNLHGKVTVPVLFAGHDMWDDSLSIARYADSVGTGRPLFADPRVCEYDAAAERLMCAGRVRAMQRAAQDERALVETLPAPLRASPAGPALGRLGLKFLRRKYAQLPGATAGDGGVACSALDAMRQVLEQARADLAGGDGAADPSRYLLGRFSYADIAVASALQFVSPVASEYIRLGRASREAWADPELQDYSDLLLWRDRLYRDHR